MDRSTSGGFRFRRWGRLLAGTMSMALVAGCATNGREARLPPDQCSRSKARPANPNGSMLAPPVAVQTAPADNAGGNDVMIFGNDADPAPARSAPEPAGEDLGRPMSAAPGMTGMANSLALRGHRQARFGSC